MSPPESQDGRQDDEPEVIAASQVQRVGAPAEDELLVLRGGARGGPGVGGGREQCDERDGEEELLEHDGPHIL